ncbi:MAG: hypothetical protein ABTQ34_03605 [Bdellovibrionales bacterium]
MQGTPGNFDHRRRSRGSGDDNPALRRGIAIPTFLKGSADKKDNEVTKMKGYEAMKKK